MPNRKDDSSEITPLGPKPDPNWLDRSRNSGRTHFRRRASKLERAREDALREWMGPGLARTEILAHQHGAVSAGAVLGQILAELHVGPPAALHELQQGWEKLVGPDVARRSFPAALQGERLIVEVRDSTWLYVLERVQKPGILAKVQALTNGQVKDIRFVAAGRRAPDKPA